MNKVKNNLTFKQAVKETKIIALLQEYNAGNYKEVITKSKKYIRKKQDTSALHNIVASSHKELKNYEKAFEHYEKSIELDENNYESINNKGVLLKQLNDINNAIKCFTQALSINNNYFEGYLNLGNALVEIGQIHNGIETYKKALEINKKSHETYNLLGKAYFANEHYEDAEKCFRKSIELKSDYFEGKSNLSAVLEKIGKIDESIEINKSIIKMNPKMNVAWHNLSQMLIKVNKIEDLFSFGNKFLNKGDNLIGPVLLLSEGYLYQHEYIKLLNLLNTNLTEEALAKIDKYGFNALHRLLIGGWILGKYDHFNDLTNYIINNFAPEDVTSRNVMTYTVYIKQLFDHKKKNINKHRESKIGLFVIGDSHSLALSGEEILFNNKKSKVFTFLNIGCKAFHLASSEDNKFKRCFINALNKIPKNSRLLISAGEIDCRLDEGFYKAHQKGYIKNIDTNIEQIVSDYVYYIRKSCCEYDVAIQGVPAPNINWNNFSNDEIKSLVQIIKQFNEILEKKCRDLNIGYIDVYSLTKNSEDISNQKWHIDEHHLKPGYLQEFLNINNPFKKLEKKIIKPTLPSQI